MSNDLDDDLNLDDDLGDSFDDFEKKQGKTLGDLWRDNAIFKVGVIVVAVILVFIIIMQLSSKKVLPDTSYVGAAPDLTSVPATDEASKAYIEAIEETNDAAVEQAFKEGGSALPVPIEPPVGQISAPQSNNDAEDPLQRWRRLQEERLKREMNQKDNLEIVDNSDKDAEIKRNEAMQALSDSMREQMSLVLESLDEGVKVETKSITDEQFLTTYVQAKMDEEDAAAEELALLNEETSSQISAEEVLLAAGKIAYGQLLTEANTDTPGPVLAQIMSGPLKGNRILGSFEEQGELLTLTFETIVIGDESYAIDAVALDPETTLPGLATEVDHRYFQRIVLPAAAAFVDGMASAVADSGRTTITVQGETVTQSDNPTDNTQEVATGIEEAGQEVREILDDMASDIETLVRIEAGTPIGILFLEPVTIGQDEAIVEE